MNPPNFPYAGHKKLLCLSGILLSIIRFTIESQGIYFLSHFILMFELPIWCYTIFNFIPSIRLSKDIISSSFPVYIIHIYILFFVKKSLYLFFKRDIWCESLIFFFFTSITTFVICVISSMYLHKFFPRVSNFLFGNHCCPVNFLLKKLPE